MKGRKMSLGLALLCVLIVGGSDLPKLNQSTEDGAVLDAATSADQTGESNFIPKAGNPQQEDTEPGSSVSCFVDLGTETSIERRISSLTCSNYCLGFITPLVNIPLGIVQWKTKVKCPERPLVQECQDLDPNAKTVLALGDNSYCFKQPLTIDDKMNAIFQRVGDSAIETIPIKRKCGKETNCRVGYCLKRSGANTTCGHTDEPFQADDPHPQCILQTADKSSLRISKDEWCCRDPDGCKTPVGKCRGKTDCHQTYCVGTVQENRHETRCPVEGEIGLEECSHLKWGQTKWIQEKKIWCCIPSNDRECNYAVRRCGFNLSCPSSFCVGEKRGGVVRTFCPDRSEEPCGLMPEGQERRLSSDRVCCKTPNCQGKVIICGDDRSCEKDFCVGRRYAPNVLLTTCPSEKEEESLGPHCSTLSPGQSLTLRLDQHWCCKRRHCGDIERGLNPYEILFLTLIVANVVTCVFCSTTLVCCRVLMFERKRARILGKEHVTKRKTSAFDQRVEELLEKLLHAKPAEEPEKDQTAASQQEAQKDDNQEISSMQSSFNDLHESDLDPLLPAQSSQPEIKVEPQQPEKQPEPQPAPEKPPEDPSSIQKGLLETEHSGFENLSDHMRLLNDTPITKSSYKSTEEQSKTPVSPNEQASTIPSTLPSLPSYP